MAQRETEPIGQLLVERGWITAGQLSSALGRQRELGGRLGTALLEMGVISEDLLVKTLAEQSGLPLADIDELRQIPQPVIDLMPAKVAIRHKAVPFRTGRGRVDVAVRDEPDIPALDELSFVLGRRVVVHIANEARIHKALERYYRDACPLRFSNLLDRLDHSRDKRAAEPPPAAAPVTPEKPRRAPARAASTVHRPATAEKPRPAPARADSAIHQPATPVAARKPARPRPTSVPLSPGEKKALRQVKSGEPVKPLSQEGVHKAFEAARHADDIGAALLGFLSQEFLRLLLFRVGQGRVRGWKGRSPSLDEYRFRNWAVGFDEPSVFLNLRQGAEFFLGRLPGMPAHERLVKCWRGSIDTECAVFPVKVRDRLVCAFYGDRDSLGLAGLDVQAVQQLTAKAAIAFEMLLMQRKLRS